MTSLHPLCLLHDFPSGHQVSSACCWSCVTKQKDFVTEMDSGWLMEVYVWETQCNLAMWVQYIYEVMTGLYRSQLEFGHTWFIKFFWPWIWLFM